MRSTSRSRSGIEKERISSTTASNVRIDDLLGEAYCIREAEAPQPRSAASAPLPARGDAEHGERLARLGEADDVAVADLEHLVGAVEEDARVVHLAAHRE